MTLPPKRVKERAVSTNRETTPGSRRRSPITTIAALAAVLVLGIAACGPSAGPIGTPATPPATVGPSGPVPSDTVPTGEPTLAPSESPSGEPGETESPSAGPTATPAPTGTMLVRAYYVIMGGTGGDAGLVPVLRTVPKTTAVATAAMNALLAGTVDVEWSWDQPITTAIPEGTLLNSVVIDNKIATVDLSGTFDDGGGSTGMFYRLAQVVYTLTQFSTVDKVVFELDGAPVDVFSAEGIILDHPMGRADFRDQLPPIFVDRPAFGAAIGNPAVVSGLANVFEATFRVELYDAKQNMIADQQVMASCGTGCWGKFKAEVPYTVAKGQWGTLRVFDLSAKDGTPENVVDYRVWLTP